MRSVPAILAWLALAGAADADDQEAAKSQVAAIAYVAEIAPAICHELKTDRDAVAALLAHAGLIEKDLTGRYGKDARAAGDDFANSARFNPAAACSRVWERLGEDGVGLLMPSGLE